MNEKTKSLVRHVLTAVGTVVALIGLNGVIPVIDFLQENLDGVWDAVEVIIGFVLTMFGFFKDKGERFVAREGTSK
jgi:hypothetical protein